MKDKLFKVLTDSWHFIKNDNVFVKTISIPGRHIIINDQVHQEDSKDITITITFLGEGEDCSDDNNIIPMYGFRLDNSDDIWVYDDVELEWWMNRAFNKNTFNKHAR